MTVEQSVSVEDQFEAEFQAALQAKAPAPSAPVQEDQEPQAAQVTAAESGAAPTAAQEPSTEQALTPEQTIAELNRQIAELQHRERSVVNRLAPVDRKNRQLEAQIAELQAQLKASPAQPPAAAPAAQAPAPAADEVPEVLADAPELRDAIDRVVSQKTKALGDELAQTRQKLEHLQGQAAAVQQELSPLAEARHDAAVASTHQQLDALFTPQWRQDVASEDYQVWKASQPAAIRALAEQAVHINDVLPVVRLYYAERGKLAPSPQPAQAPAAPAQPAGNVTPLRRAVGIPSGAAPAVRTPVAPSADDFDANFELARQAYIARRSR